MRDWRDRLGRILARVTGRRAEAAIFADLRSMVLELDPATLEVPDGEPWGGAAVAMMEIRVSGAVASVVAVADGGASMYLSTGGGVIGAGNHAAVRGAAARFRTATAESRGLFEVTEGFPLPDAGHVRFHARIGEGRYTADALEAAVRSGRHPLSTLYAAGQDLLTEIRLASEGDG